MRIFITGHQGFIGQHLVQHLQSQAHELHLLQSDLRQHQAVAKEVSEFQPQQILHLAARTEVESSFYEQTTFSDINYTGTVNLIEAAARVDCLENFVFASTMEVYGHQPISDLVLEGHYTDEHRVAFTPDTVPRPNAPYAVAKRGCELYLDYMHRTQALPYTALRQTNTYGRRDNNFFVVESIISRMISNPNEIELGYSLPYRNFLYITDLIAAWQCVLDQPDLGQRGQCYTLGPDNVIQIQALAEKIAKKIGWQGKIHWNRRPPRPGEVYWLNSDSSLFTEHTGWSPQIDLDQGLDLTIAHWQQRLGVQ